MEYLIAVIGVLVCLFLLGFFMKRKYFSEVDRYEAWKIDITNRPVLEEMSKVKKLNMTGQTEELFERWRKEWDDIVTSELPTIEELLFDAEEFTDKIRFRKVKELLATIDSKLVEIEEKIKKLLEELNELVGSEENNRNEIESLKELYRESRKNLLAHRHSFGKSESGLEQQLNHMLAKFQVFDEKTESGDYLEAREVVFGIKASLEDVVVKMEMIPRLLHDCVQGLPAQINDLKEGCREMVDKGYKLDHLGIDIEIANVEKKLSEYHTLIDETEVGEIQQGIEELNQRIDNLLDLLEKEVVAKQFINQNQQEIWDLLLNTADESEKIQDEIESVQQSYHLSGKEIDAHVLAEGQLEHLSKSYELLVSRFDQGETAYSFLSEELAELKDDLKGCHDEQQEFKEKLNALRKDEMAARDKVRDLSRMITEMIKLVTMSNLPGLSESYKYLLEDAKDSIQNVFDKLEQKPLDIPTVQQYLEIAELTVEKLSNTTLETVENVKLAERVIQYGNRYRSAYPAVAKGLKEAEESFRSYDYRQALEQAAAVIEVVEPGALKKIDHIFLETHV